MDNTESEQRRSEITVALGKGKNRLGVKFARYPLSNTFSETSNMLGSDKFSEVYFRTQTGNIYRLDDAGILIDSKMSKKRGRTIAYRLSKDQLEQKELAVGQSFKFGKEDATTEVSQIICATNNYFDEEEMKLRSGGKYSPIVEEFAKDMPEDLADYDMHYSY